MPQCVIVAASSAAGRPSQAAGRAQLRSEDAPGCFALLDACSIFTTDCRMQLAVSKGRAVVDAEHFQMRLAVMCCAVLCPEEGLQGLGCLLQHLKLGAAGAHTGMTNP